MSDNPIQNPGSSPIGPTQPPGHDRPGVGGKEGGEQPRPFSLPKEPLKGGNEAESTKTGTPSPMEAAQKADEEAKTKQQELAPEQLSDKVGQLSSQLNKVSDNLKNPEITGKFTDDHLKALNKTTDLLGKDMQSIAKNTGGEFVPPKKSAGQSALDFVIKFVDGSQGQLGSALNYLSNVKKPNYSQMLSLQYSVQRASQKGELMASIIGASVSGIKTILSTQLG